MSSGPIEIAIIGGGPAGSLLAILLARRGCKPVVIERSPQFSEGSVAGGRSINLALAARGIAALRRAGIDDEVAALLIPMRGRMVHDLDGTQRFLSYGQRPGEEINSVSRAALNTLLYRFAAERYGVEYRFEHRCIGFDTASSVPIVQSAAGTVPLAARVVFAADGAGSDVRRALADAKLISATEDLLDHGYKELTIPPSGVDRGFVLEPHALHIWPRGGFMLIALPNPDRSFTATLFLPHRGTPSFASVDSSKVGAFFRSEFPDTLPLMPALEADYRNHPTGVLGTVYCKPWSHRGRVLLIGDAAHAIVPFHGQGMNAAFEDCVELDRLLDERGGAPRDWTDVFAQFEQRRAPNARAIAAMAIENYQEMRDEVRDRKFQLRSDLSFELERLFPDRFIPRYSMVMFHPEISYAEAQRRGALQARILDRLTQSARTLADVDLALAERLVAMELS
jgi:kynurenine 3-monooxygenase